MEAGGARNGKGEEAEHRRTSHAPRDRGMDRGREKGKREEEDWQGTRSVEDTRNKMGAAPVGNKQGCVPVLLDLVYLSAVAVFSLSYLLRATTTIALAIATTVTRGMSNGQDN